MGNKGPTRHLKRHNSPSYWPIHRKSGAWSVRTSSGPHTLHTSMPINVVIRDQLKYAKTAKEAKILIKGGKMTVDGKPREDERFPVGLMDVVTFPETGESFRVLPDHGGKLRLLLITADEAKFKLVRITGKTTQPGRKTQLNLHDGQNIVVSAEADNFKVGDVLKIKIPEKDVVDHIEFKEMQQSIVTGGRSQGTQGMIIGLGPEPGWKKTCSIRTLEGEDIRTLSQYVFVVGSKEPVITLNAGEE
ncbi:30S ribosomal protein S4e [Candidatus Bathyarchaeota archaeon]|nr:30S ribosomal protein S4e [Candidatus Bathyarchaeota archaeon]